MSIQSWSDDILMVDLSKEPQMVDDLRTVTDICLKRRNVSVVIDCKAINIITSTSLSRMLKIRKLLLENENKLILCNLNPRTLHIFRLTGLVDVFCFANDKLSALTKLQMLCRQ